MYAMIATFKYIGVWTLRIILNVFNIFPIKSNRVMFYSFNGKQYSCNPRCISDALRHQKGIEIWWAFKDPGAIGVDEGIRKVRYRSVQYYYLAKTSKVVVFNVQGYGELARRNNQVFIQTWHASNGYKKVGNRKGMDLKLFRLGNRDYSYVLSGAKSMSERRVRGTLGFAGEIIPGTPRMDMLVNGGDDTIIDKVKIGLGIPSGSKLVLYAPTWRSGRSESEYGLDYTRLREALSKRFGGGWTVAVRMHPNVKHTGEIDREGVADATDYPDMQELLYAADVLISDYSSCIWDYSFTYKPCFLFCYDLKEYYSDKSFEIPIEKWRFPISEDIGELEAQIENYDEDEFVNAMKLHQSEMGALEDGKATERVCRLITEIMENNEE